MADINVNIKGDSSGAQQAMRGVGQAAGDAAGGLDEAKTKTEELTEATEKSSESQAGAAIKFALVAKAVKEVVKFVGESVKAYLDSADANKELVQVAKDFDDVQQSLKRSVGEVTLKLADQLELAAAAKGAVGLLQTAILGDTSENIDRQKRINALLDAQAELADARANRLNLKAQAASDLIDEAEIKLRNARVAMGTDVSLQDAAAQALAHRARNLAYGKEVAEAAAHQKEIENARLQAIFDAANTELATRKKAAADSMKMMAEFGAQATEMQKQEDEQRKKLEDDAAKREADRLARHAKELEAQQQKWSDAGDAIGGAFVSALSSQLAQLAQGGEFDAALFVGNILAATIAVAGTAIGSAMGQPALGAALGNIAAMGVQAAAQGISAENHKKSGLPKYHEGGWVNGGAEQVAMLRRDERVLTPEEVARMGGRSSVDSMARGSTGNGASISVSVQAIDAESAARGFERQLGVAFRRAAASGSGPLWRLSRSIA